MKIKIIAFLLLLLLQSSLFGCDTNSNPLTNRLTNRLNYLQELRTPKPTGQRPPPPEAEVTILSLASPLNQDTAELSGLSWYGDYLILLPQYPDFTQSTRSTGEVGFLYAIPKQAILARVDGTSSEPLQPIAIPFSAPNLDSLLPGFDGYEAITFDGDRLFINIESHIQVFAGGYLLAGSIAPDLSQVTLDTSLIRPLPAPVVMNNRADEAMILTPDALLTLYEVNGSNFVSVPTAYRFDHRLNVLAEVPFPATNFRITDATTLDSEGRFWAINYYFPGDEDLAVPNDPIAEQYGLGITHQTYNQVERLLEFRYDGTSIQRTDSPPLQFQLAPVSRNWEGIVRLEDRGFLLVTDTFPETILAFVAKN